MYLFLVVVIIIIFLEKITFCRTTLIFIHLIKGTVLGRALWGADTLPTRNRLLNLKFG